MSLLGRVARFGVVGVANTLVYYGVYLLLRLLLPYVVAHLLAWSVSVVVSFLLNSAYTFRVAPTWRRLVLYPLSSLPNVVMTTVGLVVLVEWLGVGERIAPLVAGVLAIPLTYLVTSVLLTSGTARPTGPAAAPQPSGAGRRLRGRRSRARDADPGVGRRR